VSGTTGQWYEVDITSPVQALRASGKTSAAIAFMGTTETLPYAAFSSRESANAPRLLVTP
jgi:hypothetical protein